MYRCYVILPPSRDLISHVMCDTNSRIQNKLADLYDALLCDINDCTKDSEMWNALIIVEDGDGNNVDLCNWLRNVIKKGSKRTFAL